MLNLRRTLAGSVKWRVRGEVKSQIEIFRAEMKDQFSRDSALLSLRILELEEQILQLRRVLQGSTRYPT